jgi:hypothetical protein
MYVCMSLGIPPGAGGALRHMEAIFDNIDSHDLR